jgi:hypothetical protein
MQGKGTVVDLGSADLVLIANAERWQEALRRLGKEEVWAKLSQRLGNPREPLYDIVYEPPFPTREFCQQWYTDEDNAFRVHPTKVGILLVLALIAIVGFAHVLGSLGVTPTNNLEARPPGLPAPPTLIPTKAPQPPFPTW